jgi:flagellar biogenesis protein FliO
MSSMVLILGILAGAGGLVVWAKKKRPASAAQPAINVIASKSLGGKARVVLLAAGERELLLSVSDRGAARLIGKWRRGDTGMHAALGADGDNLAAPWPATQPSRAATSTRDAFSAYADVARSASGSRLAGVDEVDQDDDDVLVTERAPGVSIGSRTSAALRAAVAAATEAPSDSSADDDLDGPSRGSSPSVAGILKLKLRRAGSQPEAPAHQAAGLDPEAEWARAFRARAGKGSRA